MRPAPRTAAGVTRRRKAMASSARPVRRARPLVAEDEADRCHGRRAGDGDGETRARGLADPRPGGGEVGARGERRDRDQAEQADRPGQRGRRPAPVAELEGRPVRAKAERVVGPAPPERALGEEDEEADSQERRGECEGLPGRVVEAAQPGEDRGGIGGHAEEDGDAELADGEGERDERAEGCRRPGERQEDARGDPPRRRRDPRRLLQARVDAVEAQHGHERHDRRERDRRDGDLSRGREEEL